MLPLYHPATGRPFGSARSPFGGSLRQTVLRRVTRNLPAYLAAIAIFGFLALLLLANRSTPRTDETLPGTVPGANEDDKQQNTVPTPKEAHQAPPEPKPVPTPVRQSDGVLKGLVKRQGVVVQDDPKESSQNRARRNAVKEAFRRAYEGYENTCFGQDELRPVSNQCHNWLSQGLTIVDSLDTMLIMGMFDHYQRARDWIDTKLDFNRDVSVSVFETTIRVLGGMLTAYDFTKDEMLLAKSKDLADRLLKAFDTPSGIPKAMVNLKTGESKFMGWTSGSAILAEVGTLQLEFAYLSHISGDPIYAKKAMHVIEAIKAKKPADNLYSIWVDPNTGATQRETVSLGALGDSFFEYLVKVWVATRKSVDWLGEMYFETAEAILDRLAQKSSPNQLDYLAELEHGRIKKKVDHLACFAAGMFSLGAINTKSPDVKKRHLDFAEGFGEFCYEMYARMPTKLSPEYVEADDSQDFKAPDAVSNRYFALRPEAIEAIFYLYRVTGEEKYRDMGWEMFQAVEANCKSEHGYSGIRDVTVSSPQQDDTQQSWFLAETLKYFYLLFSPPQYISLDEFVFNTEAHPVALFDMPKY